MVVFRTTNLIQSLFDIDQVIVDKIVEPYDIRVRHFCETDRHSNRIGCYWQSLALAKKCYSTTEMFRTNSKIRLMLASKKGFRLSIFCSVNIALLARLCIILVTSKRARFTPAPRVSFGNIDDDGIEIAGPMNRRNTILPTPIWGAV